MRVKNFVTGLLTMTLLAMLPAPAGVGAETAPENAAVQAASVESIAAETLLPLMAQWDAGKIRELGDRLAELPDAVAAQAVWLVASAPARIDVSQFYATALSSPSIVVRRQVIDLLAAQDSSDGPRLLLSSLIGEKDPEASAAILAAIARQPERRAVPALVSVMLDPKIPSRISSEAAGHLRRLTRTNISDSPEAWDAWWSANRQRYE